MGELVHVGFAGSQAHFGTLQMSESPSECRPHADGDTFNGLVSCTVMDVRD